MDKDKELYKSFLQGNMEAFEKIVLKYKDSLIFFICTYVKDIHISEDISQDVFVYVLQNANNYNFDFSLKAYLYLIAKCRAINYTKKNKKLILKTESYDYAEIATESLENVVLKKDLQKNVHIAMHKLKQSYQTVLFLADLEDVSYKEIANIMGRSVSNVKSLLHRARKALKKEIEKEGFYNER